MGYTFLDAIENRTALPELAEAARSPETVSGRRQLVLDACYYDAFHRLGVGRLAAMRMVEVFAAVNGPFVRHVAESQELTENFCRNLKAKADDAIALREGRNSDDDEPDYSAN